MEIEEAYTVLNKYFTQNMLEDLHRREKFDNSETDTIRKWRSDAALLRGKVNEYVDNKEICEELNSAADCFERLADREDMNR